MGDFDRLIVDRFTNLYGAPNAVDPAEFVNEYRKALGTLRTDILQKVSDRAVWNNTYHAWPTVGRCREIAEAVRQEYYPFRLEFPTVDTSDWVPPTESAKRRSADLAKSFFDYVSKIDPTYEPRAREGFMPMWVRDRLKTLDRGTLSMIASAPDAPRRENR